MVLASKFTANERLLRKRLAARLRQRRCRERKREALLQKNHPELGTKSARGSTAVVDAASRGSSPASTMGRTTPPVQQPLKERLESSESMGPCYAMGLGHYPMRNGYSYQSPHGVSAGSPGGTFDARIPPPCPSSRYETSASRVTLENPATAVLIKASNYVVKYFYVIPLVPLFIWIFLLILSLIFEHLVLQSPGKREEFGLIVAIE